MVKATCEPSDQPDQAGNQLLGKPARKAERIGKLS